jgi:hypothetical protein
MIGFTTSLLLLSLTSGSLARPQFPNTAAETHTVTAEKSSQTSTAAGSSGSNSTYDTRDTTYSWILLGSLIAAVALAFLWKTTIRINEYLRRLVNLDNKRQLFFVAPGPIRAWFKEHLGYAPLGTVRHRREFRLAGFIDLGVLPSRPQALRVFALVALNVVLCVVNVPYQEAETSATVVIRHRTGTLAVVNMIPLVILAGRNNPLIPLLGVPFDAWNFYHRWLARIVVLESIAHTLAWMIPKIHLSKSPSADPNSPSYYKIFDSLTMTISGRLVGDCDRLSSQSARNSGLRGE